MALGNLKLNIKKGKRPIDPNEIFEGLTLRGSIENIWGPQESALRVWHENYRNCNDNILEMNTGGGKTLVGLLIAQSLMHETQGHVLYVCPNNQLIEQTIHKAGECGIKVASRYKRAWHERTLFESSKAFCITNYASVFNGHSTFKNKNIEAIIFDDAHVAENIVRSQFTLDIPSDTELFRKILNIFRPHFATSCMSSRFEDASQGDWNSLVFVPMYLIHRHAQELRKCIVDSGIEEDVHNLYVWEHIKNNLHCCCVFVSGKSIEVTPSVIPLHTTPFFAPDVRRVYLTATIPTKASFVRTFGVSEPNVISPSGKSGDAQRLFVFLTADDDEKQKDETLNLVGERKSCVISPSTKRAEEWVPPASIYDTDLGHAEIQRFADSTDNEMLALVARYDGIDLPGKSCQILILDRLPLGESHFDRFIDRSLQVEALRSSHTAIKIVQAIGRIFRSNTDHGVVIIRGMELRGWLTTPRNQRLLPSLLQKQIQLGMSLNEQVHQSEIKYTQLIEGILSGDDDWDDCYRTYIDEYETEKFEEDASWYNNLLVNERVAYAKLWDGQFAEAANIFSELVEEANKNDERLGAWYSHWLGLSHMRNGEDDLALANFSKAASIRVELGRPHVDRDKVFKPDEKLESNFQSARLSHIYKIKKTKVKKVISAIESDLIYGPDTGKAEEAVKQLGLILGFNAKRPDSEEGTGPDVLWIAKGKPFGVSFELKTNKKINGKYSKGDIKDCHDHHSYLKTNYKGKIFIETIVGYALPVSSKAHPTTELRIITVEALQGLYERVREMYESVDLAGQSNYEQEFIRWLDYYGLSWSNCIDALQYHLAIDLKE